VSIFVFNKTAPHRGTPQLCLLITTLAPAFCGSIGGVAHLELGDRRLGVWEAGLHRKLNLGTAVTKHAPLGTRSINWVPTSWAMFQGKMITYSAEFSHSASGEQIGM
jgi:hypothetical protein